MFSNQDVARVREEFRRAADCHRVHPEPAQVDMFQRWREDAPVAAQGVKRKCDEEPDTCPPLPKRQLATTGTPPGSPLVPRRSMSVLRNPIWEAMFEMAEPAPSELRTDTGARHYGPPEEDPDEYDLAELVPELTPLPIVRQNATVAPPPPTPRRPSLNWGDIPEDAVPIVRQRAFGEMDVE